MEPFPKFRKQLEEAGLSPDMYLSAARRQAGKYGYNPKHVFFADNNTHKLMIANEGKLIRFGRVGYGDYLLWTWSELEGKTEEGAAETHRKSYHARASKARGYWRDNDYSPNWLSLRILW